MNNLVIENVRIAPANFRNFAGRETQFNRKGDRNFIIFLDTDKAKAIEAQGWPVRWKPDRYNEGELRAQMKVNVKYVSRDGRRLTPPKVVVITRKNRTSYDEEMVGLLDTMDIARCDLILSPYEYDGMNGHGVSAYLKTMYVTMAEDELDAKYAEEDGDEPW